MNKLNFLCSILLVICIPIVIISLSSNITFRSSEVYSYHLNDSSAMDYTIIGLSNNEMADELSDFMQHLFSDDVDVTEDTGYSVDPIFNDKEDEILLDLRYCLNVSLFAGVFALALMVLIYVYLIGRERKKAVFHMCLIGNGIGLIAVVARYIIWISPSLRGNIYSHITEVVLSSNSVLKILSSKGDFYGIAAFWQSGLALVVMAISIYVTWRLTKPPKIFKRRG